MTKLRLRTVTRRSNAIDHDGVRSLKTDLVFQLGIMRLGYFVVLEEQVVPESEFVGVLHGTSEWRSRFANLDFKPILDRKSVKTRIGGPLVFRQREENGRLVHELGIKRFWGFEVLDRDVPNGDVWITRFMPWVSKPE